MSRQPVNLLLRFILELAILWSLGYWAWYRHSGWSRYALVTLLPLLAIFAWGAFRTPADHGKGLFAVKGIVRLAIEIILFGFAGWCLWDAGEPTWSKVFSFVSLAHYLLSYDRVKLLLKN